MNNRRVESSCYLRQLIGIKLCHLVGGGGVPGRKRELETEGISQNVKTGMCGCVRRLGHRCLACLQ